jgi:hypothetical protein
MTPTIWDDRSRPRSWLEIIRCQYECTEISAPSFVPGQALVRMHSHQEIAALMVNGQLRDRSSELSFACQNRENGVQEVDRISYGGMPFESLTVDWNRFRSC